MSAGIARMSITLGVVLSSSLCLAAGTPWQDTIVAFDQPGGALDPGGPASDALGPWNDMFVSIDSPETHVLAFADNGAGDDLGANMAIRELYSYPAMVGVCAGKDNVTHTNLGTISRTAEFDLADYPALDDVNYLKFVGLDDDGEHPGYDHDAVEALDPIAPVEQEHGVPAPSAVLLAVLGAGLVGWRRHRAR